jgi:AAA+ ATPase superfamily predicted ATPase
MTKEKHLCHSFCATSDCLFIEEVYRNAGLKGRARNSASTEQAFVEGDKGRVGWRIV